VTDYASHLLQQDPHRPWHEVDDEFTEDPAAFQERRYNEFVAFLPAVQRFIYGQAGTGLTRHGRLDRPIRVLRREDIRKVRVRLSPAKRSRRLSEFLAALSEEELLFAAKWRAFLSIWRSPVPAEARRREQRLPVVLGPGTWVLTRSAAACH
jgi:hypothetical protein